MPHALEKSNDSQANTSNIKTVFLDVVNTAADTGPWIAEIWVKNFVDILFKLNTGADMSVISTDDENQIGNIAMQKPEKQLYSSENMPRGERHVLSQFSTQRTINQG